jgi:hypothetical protein
MKKCIYSTYSPLSSKHLWLRCSNFFNPSKKNSFGCAANKKIGKAKDLSAYLSINRCPLGPIPRMTNFWPSLSIPVCVTCLHMRRQYWRCLCGGERLSLLRVRDVAPRNKSRPCFRENNKNWTLLTVVYCCVCTGTHEFLMDMRDIGHKFLLTEHLRPSKKPSLSGFHFKPVTRVRGFVTNNGFWMGWLDLFVLHYSYT